MLAPELLKILVCPLCHGELRVSEQHDNLTCRACKLRFPVREGIPVMLADQAEQVE